MFLGSDRLSFGSSTSRVLSFLALHRHPVSREQVAATLWPDVVDDRAQGRLRTALWRLGSARDRLVRADGDLLGLVEGCHVDLYDAEKAGRKVMSNGFSLLEGESLINLFGRELLPGWDEPWVNAEREYYRETRVHVLEALAVTSLESGLGLLAIKACLEAIRCSPFRDTSHRLLARAYCEEGNSAEALRHLLRYRERLSQELGLPTYRVLPDLFEQLAG